MPIPFYPPLGWFSDPQFTEPHPQLEVTSDGRVRAHLIVRNPNDPHISRIEPGPSPTGYSRYHRSGIMTDCGEGLRHLDVGLVRMLDQSVVAYVRAGDDELGLWVAGALLPGVGIETHELLTTRPLRLSGEWHAGELVEITVIDIKALPGFRWPPLDEPRDDLDYHARRG